jgi:pantoate kinase
VARAWAPGHVTCFFSAVERDDPLEAGSRGAGITVEDGVTVGVEPADATTVAIDGEPAQVGVVERLFAMLDVEAKVTIANDVPVGCGFGASGAAVLASALAADEAFALDRDREQLVAAAHAAEVREGTGLGDVVPQSLGGVVTRVHAGTLGIGDFGSLDVPDDLALGYTAFGELDTADVLGDDETMAAVNEAGDDALDALLRDPALDTLFERSWKFARRTGLVTERVASTVAEAHRSGGKATMTMLGETAMGVGADDVFEEVTTVAAEGARLLEG